MPDLTNDISKNIFRLSKFQQGIIDARKHNLQGEGDSNGKLEAEKLLTIKKDQGALPGDNSEAYAHIPHNDRDNKEKLKKKVFNFFNMKKLLKDEEDFYIKLFLAAQKATEIKENDSKALKKAIEEQNFIFASQMIRAGVSLDKDCESAFATAMHTDSEVVKRYYSYVGSDKFRGNDFGVGDFRHHKVKKYGLSLGVRFVAADGTSSGYGYTGPALDEVTKRLGLYSKTDQRFQEIYMANVRSLSACNYYGSRVRSEGASRAISDMVQNACRGGGVVCVPCGFSQHMIGVYIVDGYLVVSDRQTRAGHTPGTKIYKITDPSAYSPEVIDTLITGMGKAKSKEEVMGALLCGVEPAPVYSIQQKAQKMDNCTIANPKSVIEGVLFVQELRRTSSADLDKVKREAHLRYKEFTKDFRRTTVQELIEAIIDDPNDNDLRGLAVAYINQQYSRERHDLFLQLYDVLGDEQREEVASSIRESLSCVERDKSVSEISARMQSLMGVFFGEQAPLLSPLERSPECLPSSFDGKKKSMKAFPEKDYLVSDFSNMKKLLGAESLESSDLLKSFALGTIKQASTKKSYISNFVEKESTIPSIRLRPVKV